MQGGGLNNIFNMGGLKGECDIFNLDKKETVRERGTYMHKYKQENDNC